MIPSLNQADVDLAIYITDVLRDNSELTDEQLEHLFDILVDTNIGGKLQWGK